MVSLILYNIKYEFQFWISFGSIVRRVASLSCMIGRVMQHHITAPSHHQPSMARPSMYHMTLITTTSSAYSSTLYLIKRPKRRNSAVYKQEIAPIINVADNNAGKTGETRKRCHLATKI